jgi:hypothetical protein
MERSFMGGVLSGSAKQGGYFSVRIPRAIFARKNGWRPDYFVVSLLCSQTRA